MKNFTLFRSLAFVVALLFVGTAFAQGTGESEEKAYSVAEAQAAYVENQPQEVWVKGYIVGYVTGSALDKGAHFDLSDGDVPFSNILLADSKDETDYQKCMPIQLVSKTDFRAAINLGDNPENLGKSLTFKASLETYFGVAGMKGTVTEYTLDGESGSVDPTPTETYTYNKVTAVESGKTYLFVAPVDDSLFVANNLKESYNYGYFYCDKVEGAEKTKIEFEKSTNNFVLTAVEGGYTIQDSYGRYLYMSGNYNSFNVSAERVDGDVWSIDASSDGTFKITNVAKGKYMQYSLQYHSYGAYSNESGVMPYLYQLDSASTGIGAVVEDGNAPVEVYTLNGVKVGSSLDGLKSGIYLVKKGNKVQKVLK